MELHDRVDSCNFSKMNFFRFNFKDSMEISFS